MSAMSSVLVERVTAGEAVFRVTTIHPDASPPPSTAKFPVDLLCDLWSRLDGNVGAIEGCTLSQAEAHQLARDPRWGDPWERLRGLQFGHKVRCTVEEYAALMDDLEQGNEMLFRGQPVGALYGGDAPAVHVFADPAEYDAAVTSLVADHGVDARENVDAFKNYDEGGEAEEEKVLDRSELPRARVTVRLHQPELLGWVRSGWCFDSASG